MKRIIYATAHDTEAAFYEAIEKSDLEAMMAVWADDDDIVCVHPGGVRFAGVAQVRESWRKIFAGGQHLHFRLLLQHSITGATLVVHSVYEEITVVGEAHPAAPVIATNAYLRTEHGWRMVLHHASSSPAQAESNARRAPKTLH
ncbi:MAG TPA: nuclear transport factor 2 family protein [Burkholderiales bacterium]|nr:nuclear transport factor 2 family protein [Burkholderiales bacterium]